MIDTYTSLHVHSEFSSALLGFTDSIIRIPEALKWCYDNRLYGMALSDHEGTSGWVEMEQEINKLNFDRPFRHIFANEIYLVSEAENNKALEDNEKIKYWHFLLIALDEIGVHQIYELSSRAWLRSYMYRGLRRRPTFYSDIEEVIGKNKGHIVGSTACLGGYLPHCILENYNTQAKQFIQWGKMVFGDDKFFLECQPCYSDNEEQLLVNKTLWQLHLETDTLIIVTTDAHYLTEAEKSIHAAYLNSKDGGDTREADKFYATAHFFTPEELRKTLYISGFTDEQIDLMFTNTNNIADNVQDIKLKKTTQVPALPSLPEFKIQGFYRDYYKDYPYIAHFALSKDPYEQYYYAQVESGLAKYQETHEINIRQYLEQINTEMEQVKGLGEIFDNQRMCDYFTVIQKVIDLIWSDGDSLVGIGRGSAGAYVTNKLLGITGIDPLLPEIADFYPWWRFCSIARSDSIFDIDVDIQSFKKEKIIKAIKNYFGERRVCQVVTWGRLSARTAIERACRGMGIPNDTAGYLRSLVPVKRGQVYSLKDCLYGNKEKGRDKVPGFETELKKYPNLLETALAFEGLIISSGVHAGALNVLKTDFTDTGSLMVSNNGAVISQYDLHHGEYAGMLKFDLLSIDALENIRACMDLLIKNNKIKWQGNLRDTYNHYLCYDILEMKNKEMWALLPEMSAAFQYDSRAGKEALRKIGATNIVDLTLANGLMRLAVPEGEQPMDKYIRYRDNIQEWYNDMTEYGLTEEEQEIYKRLLGKYSGMCISQETMMVMLMDKEVCGFTLKEADKARKAVAKKNEQALKETEERLYRKGAEQGRSEKFLDYLWRVQIEMSKSYAFAFSHSHEYSTECVQELNLYWKYPKIYWNTAVVTTQAQLADERENVANSVNYGKIASSIYKAKQNNIEVQPPSINYSDLDFTPREENNSILFGIGGISGINNAIAEQIISNRPYKSFTDFYHKNTFTGSLVTPSKIVSLIKAGCFDEFNSDRIKVMKIFVKLSTQPKQTLTLANIPQAIEIGVAIPKKLLSVYNFRKYCLSKEFFYSAHPNFKSKKLYWLDSRSEKYFKAKFANLLTEGSDWWYDGDTLIVVDKSIDKATKEAMDNLKTFITSQEVVNEFNQKILMCNYKELIKNNEDANHWSFEAVSYYSREHELNNINANKYSITPFESLPEEPRFVLRQARGREWRNYELNQIAGTVIARNDNHHMVTILDYHNNIVNIKLDQGLFAIMKSQISEIDELGNKVVIEPVWLKRGETLIFTGYRNGVDEFRCKSYKNSIYDHKIKRIIKTESNGNMIIQSVRKGIEE